MVKQIHKHKRCVFVIVLWLADMKLEEYLKWSNIQPILPLNWAISALSYWNLWNIVEFLEVHQRQGRSEILINPLGKSENVESLNHTQNYLSSQSVTKYCSVVTALIQNWSNFRFHFFFFLFPFVKMLFIEINQEQIVLSLSHYTSDYQ